MRPARPTKLAAIQPTTTDVLVPPEEVGVALGVAEDAMLLVAGTILDSENVGTLLVGISTGVIEVLRLLVEEVEVAKVVGRASALLEELVDVLVVAVAVGVVGVVEVVVGVVLVVAGVDDDDVSAGGVTATEVPDDDVAAALVLVSVGTIGAAVGALEAVGKIAVGLNRGRRSPASNA